MKLTKKELRELGNRKISKKELFEVDPNTKYLAFGKKSKGMSVFYIYYIPEMLYLDYQPKYVLFQEENDFITLVNAAAGNYGWSAKNTNVLLIEEGDYSKKKPESLKILSTSKCQFENSVDLIEQVQLLQAGIKDNRLNEKHQKIKDRIDAQMDRIPVIPKDFIKWIEKKGKARSLFKYDNVIYYKKEGSFYTGYCTACEKEFSLEHPTHNEKGHCPECNHSVIYKSQGLTKTHKDFDNWYLIQRLKKSNDIVCRFFIGTKKYGTDYRNPIISYEEVTRVIIEESGNSMVYSYAKFLNTEEIRWREGIVNPGMGMNSYSRSELMLGPMYTSNLSKVFKDTVWQYAPFEKYPLNAKILLPTSYLEAFAKYPQIEYLVKIGLTTLVDELFLSTDSTIKEKFNREAKNAHDFLGVQRKDLAQVCKHNMSFHQLGIYKTLKNNGTFLDKNGKTIFPEISDELFVRTYEVFGNDTSMYYASGGIQKLLTVFQYTTIVKMLNYIDKQLVKYKKLWQDRGGSRRNEIGLKRDIISEWVDYIRISREVEAQFKKKNKEITPFETFPQNLKERHDEVVTLKNEERLSAKSEIIKKLNEHWEHYHYTDNELGFTIRPPKDAFELVNESNKLQHCVKTYIDKVCDEKTTILFVRDSKSPEVPVYTGEYRDGGIVQFRGEKNKAVPDDAQKFISDWQKYIKQEVIKRKKRYKKCS